MLKNYRIKLLFFIAFVTLSGMVSAFQADTLKTETINGKVYVIHTVSPKETVFSLARKYEVAPKLITEVNPEIKGGLNIGQIVKIPFGKEVVRPINRGTIHTVKEKETLFSLSQLYRVGVDELKEWNNLKDNSLDIGQQLVIKKEGTRPNPIQLEKADFSGKQIHLVKEKETLFGISQQYGVSIDQIKKWNNLTGNSIDLGQRLVVGEKKVAAVSNDTSTSLLQKVDTVKVITILAKDTVSTLVDIDSVKRETKMTVDDSPEQVRYDSTYFETKTVKNGNGFEEKVQNGLAELIAGSRETRKYLALHRTAKIGTIMKVRNEMNNKMVFVRVLGRIPDTGDNNKVLIKLSNAAYKRLGALDKRFRVELSYMP